MTASVSFGPVITYCQRVYDRLHCPDPGDALVPLLYTDGLPQPLARQWRTQTRRALIGVAPFASHGLRRLLRTKRLSQFEDAMFPIVVFFLLRATHGGGPFSLMELSQLVEAIVIGGTGYRLVDYCDDGQAVGEDVRPLGQFLIHSHETMLCELFAAQSALDVLREHTALYHRAEYLEKGHRWRGCPFRWEAAEQIGWKSSPLFAVLELILRRAGKQERQVLALRDACLRFGAALQMVDDVVDAQEDLAGGIETLALSGYYETCGSRAAVTQATIDRYLYPRRVKMLYRATCRLFDQAREAFAREQEEILELHLEVAFHRLHEQIRFDR
jgi:hypothetical protein